MLPNIDNLSLAEQVAQIIVVRASGYLFDHQIKYPQWEAPNAKLQHWLQNLGVGGVILLGGSAGELAWRSQQLQKWAKIPLLIAADVEEGVGQRFSGATWFPPPMAISGIWRKNPSLAQSYAAQMGAIIAQESVAIGINWVLAPVVDVNNNPENPVINVRAFGETPAEVSQLVAAFIGGAQAYPVLTTAKHFPGHGDTATDSHLELPVLPHSITRLAEVELPPFVEAIAAGVATVMTAHLLIPAWDGEFPATLSYKILTEELRQKLGFQGLIVTDALVMRAIANRYGGSEAAIMALEAGADILLMPVDPEQAIAAICAAVDSGRISAARIRASVERIWQAKGKVFAENTQFPVENSVYAIASPTSLNTVTDILQDSQTVSGSLPLSLPPSHPKFHNLIVVDDILDTKFLDRQAPAITIPKGLGYQLQLLDQNSGINLHQENKISEDSLSFTSLLPSLDESDRSDTLLQLFIRGNPFRGSAGLNQLAEQLFEILLKTHRLQALIVYGSPYIKERLFASLPPEIPGIFSYGQIPAAQKIALAALFGK